MFQTSLLLIASFAGVHAMSAKAEAPAASPADYVKSVETWRAQRVERLTAPTGWLSLIGLHWLKEGANRVGSAVDNDIVLAAGPAHFGTVTLTEGKVSIRLDPTAGALINGQAGVGAQMLDDAHEVPTTVSAGTVNFYLIDRNGSKGLRVKDSQAEARTHFRGIESFPIDPSWRIEATWVPFDPPHTLETPNVLGQIDSYPVPGKAVFERDGKTFELLPVIEVPGDKELFLIFADRTSGKETYGAARFLYAPMPRDGKIVLDFNKAYNPPCAFTGFATCPLAPPENRLDLRVTAGEKKYAGGPH
ncbi:MAG: DUF1684 domain-containing protein [Dokdonella sp.]|uniref:DUF1684 domain-containing protein n=1 Tax=Dokdonella sp. TaxID=2291710 RepID=UPI0025BA7489|nr:DUF1684 domain-containing protein [Dokdonella sp.]MBZ0222737.1 DUF1684 domain-containing protein [Dokdonella sp.]